MERVPAPPPPSLHGLEFDGTFVKELLVGHPSAEPSERHLYG